MPGSAAGKEALTLSKFIDEIWWPKYRVGGGKRGVNSTTTIMEKETHLRVHILPTLGQLPIVAVSNERLTEFSEQLRESGYQKKGRRATSTKEKAEPKRKEREGGRKDRGKPRRGLSEKSVKNIRTTLNTIFGYAVRWGYLAHALELPEVVVPESSFDWYQPPEARRLLAAARDEWARTVLLFALHTGVGRGEQRAVRWSDVDFENHIITIRRSSPKWLIIEKSPKSNRHRRVDLTPELAEALNGIRRHGEVIFCNADGSKLQPGQIPRDSLGRAEEGGAPADQVARAPALLRIDPHNGRRSAPRGAVVARSLVDQDDGTLRAWAERGVHASAVGDFDADDLRAGGFDADDLGPRPGPNEPDHPSKLRKLGPRWAPTPK